MDKPPIILAFLAKDQWERLRQVMVGGELLGSSYEEWLAVHERQLEKARADGRETTLLNLNVYEFETRCEQRCVPVDQLALTFFIAELNLRAQNKERPSDEPSADH